MAVLKTTSPTVWPTAPMPCRFKTVPSARTRMARKLSHDETPGSTVDRDVSTTRTAHVKNGTSPAAHPAQQSTRKFAEFWQKFGPTREECSGPKCDASGASNHSLYRPQPDTRLRHSVRACHANAVNRSARSRASTVRRRCRKLVQRIRANQAKLHGRRSILPSRAAC